MYRMGKGKISVAVRHTWTMGIRNKGQEPRKEEKNKWKTKLSLLKLVLRSLKSKVSQRNKQISNFLLIIFDQVSFSVL